MEYLIFVAIVCISIWGYKRIDWLRYGSDGKFQYYLLDSWRIIEVIVIITEIILCFIAIGAVIYFGGQLIKWIGLCNI